MSERPTVLLCADCALGAQYDLSERIAGTFLPSPCSCCGCDRALGEYRTDPAPEPPDPYRAARQTERMLPGVKLSGHGYP